MEHSKNLKSNSFTKKDETKDGKIRKGLFRLIYLFLKRYFDMRICDKFPLKVGDIFSSLLFCRRKL